LQKYLERAVLAKTNLSTTERETKVAGNCEERADVYREESDHATR